MEASHVLVVHTDAEVHRLVAELRGQDGFHVSLASSDEEGLAVLEAQRVHVLVTALGMFGAGDEFVRRAATIQPLLGVVLIVESGRIDAEAQRAQLGPVQYVAKPVTRDSLRLAVQRILDRQAKRRQTVRRETDPPAGDRLDVSPAGPDRIVAVSAAMRAVLATVQRCAPTDVPVLIQGEPDTGKDSIAREIHRRSRRAAGPLIRLACGSLRESELAESLFRPRTGGADRTAATASTSGGLTPAASTLMEQAHGGTLFLENISALPPWGQARLLDALAQLRGAWSGGQESAGPDVRLIASTTEDLQAAVARGTFLPSLYYRLNIVQITLPPLRHRTDDIRPLAENCLASANAMRRQQGCGPCRLGEDALRCMVEYEWPGNLLQLVSVVTHAALLADEEEIGRAKIAASLGEFVARSDADAISVPIIGGLRQIERAVITAVVERCGGNKAAAARMLRLHRRTLYRILQDTSTRKKGPGPLPLVDVPVADFGVHAVG